jgi:hypothetical protein
LTLPLDKPGAVQQLARDRQRDGTDRRYSIRTKRL